MKAAAETWIPDIGIAPYYADSHVAIFHADARELLPLLPRVDAVVTDPPYGILNLANGTSTAIRKSRRAAGSGKLKDRMINTASFEWDSEPPTIEFLKEIISKADAAIIWGGNYMPLPPTRCVLAWDKCQPWENFSQVEIAWTTLDRPAAIFRHDKSDIPNKAHPTQKPAPLMKWCLRFVEDAQVILDPYAGSCTTAVAAKQLGRRCICIESEEPYCEVGAQRCRQGVLW